MANVPARYNAQSTQTAERLIAGVVRIAVAAFVTLGAGLITVAVSVTVAVAVAVAISNVAITITITIAIASRGAVPAFFFRATACVRPGDQGAKQKPRKHLQSLRHHFPKEKVTNGDILGDPSPKGQPGLQLPDRTRFWARAG
jgi:hypothetical protein